METGTSALDQVKKEDLLLTKEEAEVSGHE